MHEVTVLERPGEQRARRSERLERRGRSDVAHDERDGLFFTFFVVFAELTDEAVNTKDSPASGEISRG